MAFSDSPEQPPNTRSLNQIDVRNLKALPFLIAGCHPTQSGLLLSASSGHRFFPSEMCRQRQLCGVLESMMNQNAETRQLSRQPIGIYYKEHTLYRNTSNATPILFITRRDFLSMFLAQCQGEKLKCNFL